MRRADYDVVLMDVPMPVLDGLAATRPMTPPAVDRLAEALHSGDTVAVSEQAHSLKGSAGNIGATALAALFADLENRARAGQLPTPGAPIGAIRAELDLVVPIVTAVAGQLHRSPAR